MDGSIRQETHEVEGSPASITGTVAKNGQPVVVTDDVDEVVFKADNGVVSGSLCGKIRQITSDARRWNEQ